MLQELKLFIGKSFFHLLTVFGGDGNVFGLMEPPCYQCYSCLRVVYKMDNSPTYGTVAVQILYFPLI